SASAAFRGAPVAGGSRTEDTMKRNHLLSVITALGVIAATTAFAQDGTPQGGGGMSGPGHRAGAGTERYKMRRADVLKELNLSDAQRTKLGEIRDRQMR